MGKLFGTDGIRGKAGNHPVTAEMAVKLGRSVVKILGGKLNGKILIGRDTRESGPMLEAGLIQGICEAGATAVSLGVVPTPAVAYHTRELSALAGIMLTASHNPFEDNGMKVFGAAGYKLSDEQEAQLEAELLSSDTSFKSDIQGNVSAFQEALQQYADAAKASIQNTHLDGLRVVIDAGNGAAYQVASEIFTQLGAEVISIFNEPNGKNINENCGALHANFAAEQVLASNAHLGVSFDGDADRVIFTDEIGQVISGDQVLAMCALALKQSEKLPGYAIVTTVMSNLGLDEAMRNAGIQVLRAGVGDRFVLEKMREQNIVFGGENSGHLIFAEHATTGDGIVAALQVCKMMIDTGKKLSQLSRVMNSYPSELRNLSIRKKVPLHELAHLSALITEAEAEFGALGRQLIRYSGTENKIRVLVEHRDVNRVSHWMDLFESAIMEEIG